MNWAHDAVAEFGRRMGLEEWHPTARGVAQFQWPDGSRLAIEAARDEVLVYLVQATHATSPARWLEALERCHVRRRGAWPIQVGRRVNPDGDTDIVVLTRMPERALTPQQLEEAVSSVLRWRDGWLLQARE